MGYPQLGVAHRRGPERLGVCLWLPLQGVAHRRFVFMIIRRIPWQLGASYKLRCLELFSGDNAIAWLGDLAT